MKEISKIVAAVLSVIGMILSFVSIRFAIPVGLIMTVLKAFAVINIGWWNIIWITVGMLALGLVALVINFIVLTLTSKSM